MKIPVLRFGFFVLVVSSFMIYVSMAAKADSIPIGYTEGKDTFICGGSISTDSALATFAHIPLAVGSDIAITQLVNVTNRDLSDHSVQVCVTAENFGSELSSLRLYLVSPSGKTTLVVELDDFGDVSKERVSVGIRQGEEWSVKLVGHYDSGVSPSQSNAMILTIQVMA
ncbi:MAG: hypothetical protein ACXADS_15935 [Candidatus Thorarchaeota archaeon]